MHLFFKFLMRRRALFTGAAALMSLTAISSADTYVVDTTSDADLSACTAAPSDCSLRGAINRVNARGGFDTINFTIPGAGVKKIEPATPLPVLTARATTIDGSTQIGLGAAPLIELSGAALYP